MFSTRLKRNICLKEDISVSCGKTHFSPFCSALPLLCLIIVFQNGLLLKLIELEKALYSPGSSFDSSNKHLYNWKNVCKSKDQDGLDVIDISFSW